MWVISGSFVGHIQIALWVSGSSGSTSVTHFQPWDGVSSTKFAKVFYHQSFALYGIWH